MRVQCYVYDISQGMARNMSMMLIGKHVELIPHTGIVCFGKEYFFGGGICVSPQPGNCIPLKPCQILDLGNTSKSQAELDTWLRTQHNTWNQATYNLLKHNCNHFANSVATFLGVTAVPSNIVNIADEALSTPRGAQIRQLIETFDSQMRQSTGGMAMNPFGDVGGDNNYAHADAPPGPPESNELRDALADIAKAPTEEQRACLQTLLTLAKNANNNRTDPKFQKIKMENPAFVKKVCNVNGGTDTMLALGFLPDTHDGIDYWVMQPERQRDLDKCIESITSLLAKLPAPPAPTPVPAPAAPTGFGAPISGLGQAQQAMQQNPNMMAEAQRMMQQNPQLMAQAQAMMNDPAAMQRLMQQFGNRPP